MRVENLSKFHPLVSRVLFLVFIVLVLEEVVLEKKQRDLGLKGRRGVGGALKRSLKVGERMYRKCVYKEFQTQRTLQNQAFGLVVVVLRLRLLL